MNLMPLRSLRQEIGQLWSLIAWLAKSETSGGPSNVSTFLETLTAKFFNAWKGWELVSLNTSRPNAAAADLVDRGRRIAIQVTNSENRAQKVAETVKKAVEHGLVADFDQLIIFFVLPTRSRVKVPAPCGSCPKIEIWALPDLFRRLDEANEEELSKAYQVLKSETGGVCAEAKVDIDRLQSETPTPEVLFGRDPELKQLRKASQKVLAGVPGRPHVVTIAGFGGEGKSALLEAFVSELAHQDWLNFERVFAWKFGRPGLRNLAEGSSELFLREALTFFGDAATAESKTEIAEKGRRLAKLLSGQRSLLLLDGLEPLQRASSSEFQDLGLASLLRGMAASSRSLCIATSRLPIPELQVYHRTTAPEIRLQRLPLEAGVQVLRSWKVCGSEIRNIACGGRRLNELEALVEDVQGHALTLNLLGSFLKQAHHGHIEKRYHLPLRDLGQREQDQKAFCALEAYEVWLESGGGDEKLALELWRLTGLFDQAVSAACLGTLFAKPAIASLTDSVVAASTAERNSALSRLEEFNLLKAEWDVGTGDLVSVNAHPLVREHFHRKLHREFRDAAQAAHRRLFEHLSKEAVKEFPTFPELLPFYEAIPHGCQAGLAAEAFELYRIQMLHGSPMAGYSWRTLGAVGPDVSALANFFTDRWQTPHPVLAVENRGAVCALAGFLLDLQGRLREGESLLVQASQILESVEHWPGAARVAACRSLNALKLGRIREAVRFSHLIEELTEKGRDQYSSRIAGMGFQLDAYHQLGDFGAAQRCSRILKWLWKEDPHAESHPLHFQPVFHVSNLALQRAERAAWRTTMTGEKGGRPMESSFRLIESIARRTLSLARAWPLGNHVGLSLLTLHRIRHFRSLLSTGKEAEAVVPEDDSLVDMMRFLRSSGAQDDLVRGLLHCAWKHGTQGGREETERARADLEEAWLIAARGPMKLLMADICLHRARLFGGPQGRLKRYPWDSVEADLAWARKIVAENHYGRRQGELAAAEAVLIRHS